jgi:hypothetical protein
MELQLAQHVTYLKDVAGKDFDSVKACIRYGAQAHASSLYEAFLGRSCPSEIPIAACTAASRSSISGPSLPIGSRRTLRQDTCERLIGSAKTSAGIAGEVYRILMAVPGQFPTMDGVATTLNMTSRTPRPRRRLAEERTLFASIIDDVGRTFSEEYLRTTKIAMEDIEILVGFSYAANLSASVVRQAGGAGSAVR